MKRREEVMKTPPYARIIPPGARALQRELNPGGASGVQIDETKQPHIVPGIPAHSLIQSRAGTSPPRGAGYAFAPSARARHLVSIYCCAVRTTAHPRCEKRAGNL